MTDAVLTLQEVADELGVHYMTAYRYVRLGMMDAVKSGGVWQVQRSALDRYRQQAAEAAAATGPSGKGGARNRKAPWAGRLESRLVAGDAPGSWSVVEAAMAAGAELDEIYLDVLTPAMVSIGERWAAGELDVSVEHRATGIAMRIVGRIGPRFTRRGRSRGVVALGAPAGEFHALPVASLGDLLRLRGWEVSGFGVDVPSESIAHAGSFFIPTGPAAAGQRLRHRTTPDHGRAFYQPNAMRFDALRMGLSCAESSQRTSAGKKRPTLTL